MDAALTSCKNGAPAVWTPREICGASAGRARLARRARAARHGGCTLLEGAPATPPPLARLLDRSYGLVVTGGHALTARPGKIVDVDLETGAEREIPVDLENPTQVRAGPDGALWVTDFGQAWTDANGVHARRRTGSLWKIRPRLP